MPIEAKYPFDEVVGAAAPVTRSRGAAGSHFEYVLLGGVNDNPGPTRALSRGGSPVGTSRSTSSPERGAGDHLQGPHSRGRRRLRRGARRSGGHGVRAPAPRAGTSSPRAAQLHVKKGPPPRPPRPTPDSPAPLRSPLRGRPRPPRAGLLVLLLRTSASPRSNGPRSTHGRGAGDGRERRLGRPEVRGRPFFDKPVLSYWLMAAANEGVGGRRLARRASCPSSLRSGSCSRLRLARHAALRSPFRPRRRARPRHDGSPFLSFRAGGDVGHAAGSRSGARRSPPPSPFSLPSRRARRGRCRFSAPSPASLRDEGPDRPSRPRPRGLSYCLGRTAAAPFTQRLTVRPGPPAAEAPGRRSPFSAFGVLGLSCSPSCTGAWVA